MLFSIQNTDARTNLQASTTKNDMKPDVMGTLSKCIYTSKDFGCSFSYTMDTKSDSERSSRECGHGLIFISCLKIVAEEKDKMIHEVSI